MDSDDDSDGYRRPSVLPVASFDDFDPSKPPVSGEEYLRRVQLEAQACPEIAVAQVDVNSFRGQQTETLSCANGFNPVKSEDRMAVDKQHEIIAYFTSLRMRVSGMREKILEKKILEKEIPEKKIPEKKIPEKGSIQRETPATNDGKKSVQRETPAMNDHEAWRRYIMEDGVGSRDGSGEGHDPHLGLLLKLDQSGHHKLLKNLLTWTVEDGFCDKIGLWIFSLLACLEKPIHSDIYATLRDISRSLSRERKETHLEPRDIKSINIIICIIGRYFDQKDMVDE